MAYMEGSKSASDVCINIASCAMDKLTGLLGFTMYASSFVSEFENLFHATASNTGLTSLKIYCFDTFMSEQNWCFSVFCIVFC